MNGPVPCFRAVSAVRSPALDERAPYGSAREPRSVSTKTITRCPGLRLGRGFRPFGGRCWDFRDQNGLLLRLGHCCGFLNPKPVSTREPTTADLLAQAAVLEARRQELIKELNASPFAAGLLGG